MVRRVAVLAYHCSPTYEPGSGDAGGMTVYVRKLADALASSGISTDIFTRTESPADRITDLAPRVRVIPIVAGPEEPLPKESLPPHIGEFVAGIRAHAIASRARYDIVHSHYWQSGLAGSALAAGWNVPLVHSHHTLGKVKNGLLALGDLPEPLTRLAGEQKVISRADVLVASTDEECEQLACLYGAGHDRLKTIHPGVDHEAFSPGEQGEARAVLGWGPEPVLLAVGRIQRLKGFDLALSALAQLQDARTRLVILGGASGAGGMAELDRLVSLASSLGIGQRVRFEGPIPHRRLPLYYRASDAVVVTSHSESFGFAALEAHSCARPVVATAVGGLSFIVEDGVSGNLLPDRDPVAFAASLDDLLSSESRRSAMGAAAAARAFAFSWPSAAGQFLELYECLVSEELTELCTC